MSMQPASSGASTSKKSKPKTKSKSNLKSTEFIDDQDEDSAEVQEAALLRRYEAVSSTLDETDWERIRNDPNLELWAVRIPRNMKAKALNDLEIALPSSSNGNAASTFTKKGTTYSVRSAEAGPNQIEGEDISLAAEMQSFTCLLSSRSRNGQLYPAPKPFSRHIVISEPPSDATSVLRTRQNNDPEDGAEIVPLPHGHSKRPYQPIHLLKHTFSPLGSGTPNDQVPEHVPIPTLVPASTPAENTMEVDGEDVRPSKKAKRKHDDAKLSAPPIEPSPKKEKSSKSKRVKEETS